MSFVGDIWDGFLKYNPITLAGNFASSASRDLFGGGAPANSTTPSQGTFSYAPDGPVAVLAQIQEKKRQQQLQQQQQQMPSMTDIMSRLQQLSDPSRYASNPDSLIAQARAAASAQYDPVIAQLRGQANTASTRANRDKQSLGTMFKQLSGSLQGDIPAINQNFDNTKQQTQQGFDQLNNKVQNTYNQSQADQEAMMKRLNIEAAAPDAMGNQFRDKAYFTDLANQNAQTAQTALNTEQRGNVEYTRRGSEMAQTEGVQRQADLMSKLQDMLAAYDTQIGANEAAKSQAFTSGLGQLQQKNQELSMSASQRDFDNYLKSIQMGRDLSNDAYSHMLKGQVTKTASPADVAGRAITLGLDPTSAQAIQNSFTNAIGSDPIILSGLNSDSGTPAPKEALAARVVAKGREAGLSQQQLNALQVIALEYFGRA